MGSKLPRTGFLLGHHARDLFTDRQVPRWLILLLMSMAWIGDSSVYADTVAEGAELFSQYCSNCHGPKAQGLALISGDFKVLRERLSGATQNMPDFSGLLSDQEIIALFAFIDSRRQPPVAH